MTVYALNGLGRMGKLALKPLLDLERDAALAERLGRDVVNASGVRLQRLAADALRGAAPGGDLLALREAIAERVGLQAACAEKRKALVDVPRPPCNAEWTSRLAQYGEQTDSNSSPSH